MWKTFYFPFKGKLQRKFQFYTPWKRQKNSALRSSERLMYVPVFWGRESLKTQKNTDRSHGCLQNTYFERTFLGFQTSMSAGYRNVQKTFRGPENRVFLTFSVGTEMKLSLKFTFKREVEGTNKITFVMYLSNFLSLCFVADTYLWYFPIYLNKFYTVIILTEQDFYHLVIVFTFRFEVLN